MLSRELTLKVVNRSFLRESDDQHKLDVVHISAKGQKTNRRQIQSNFYGDATDITDIMLAC
jgi:hypothetical protein